MIIAKGLINFFGLHQNYDMDEEGYYSTTSCYFDKMTEEYSLVKKQGEYSIRNKSWKGEYVAINASSTLEALGLFREFLRDQKKYLMQYIYIF